MTAEPNGHENAPALITLAYSRSARIVAIPGGEKYRQAQTTLQAAGFQHRANGTYVLPPNTLAETADTAASMADLIRLAQAQWTTITTSSRPYIGDIGQDIATHLPGTWSASVDVYSHPVWQTDLEPWLWDTGELSHAVRTSRIPYAALLKDGQGTELLLVERPGHASGYLVGAFVPEAFEGNAKDPNAPRSIVLPGSPIAAARAIVDQFLPAYHQADYDRRITEMAAALDQTSREHVEWQSMAESGRYSDATPHGP
ncbi:hypothetical protein ACFC0C_16335 [Streptomyces sp. NPDC056178]|uniref:hypothetical protein n=1 Tax=unclassified Streptomyces TaxID=2593676 RepID=UPI0035DB2815